MLSASLTHREREAKSRGPSPLAQRVAESLHAPPGRLAMEQLTQHTPAQLRLGFQSAIGDGNSSSPLLAPKDSFLLVHLHNLVQQLTHGPSTVKCWVDPTLFRQVLPSLHQL